jgi:hypothetical protein
VGQGGARGTSLRLDLTHLTARHNSNATRRSRLEDPKYTVVAEKFHAVCLLGMANTRMKDSTQAQMQANNSHINQ